MSTQIWIPDEIPLDRPNAARMYDYVLGGYHNFEVDRTAAERMLTIHPGGRQAAIVNRAFLRRAIKFLAGQGIDQFLDIGSGIPTAGNVHEVAQGANPAAHVVYVDIDPIAVAHSRAMLRDNPSAAAVRGDLRQPDQILSQPEVRKLLDLSRPVAVLLVAVLHFMPDDEQAYRIVGALRDAVAAGSYIVISHASREGMPPEVMEQLRVLYARSDVQPRERSFAEIQPFFDGLELVEPGLVLLPLWRPEGPDDPSLDAPERVAGFAGVGRRP